MAPTKNSDKWGVTAVDALAEERWAPKPLRKDRCLVTVLTGADQGMIFALDGHELTIGRDDTVTAQLQDPGLSRRHARIFRTMDDSFMIQDLGSTNGTFLRGARLSAPAQLHEGDRIGIGSGTEMTFTIHDATEEETMLRLQDAAVRDPLTGVYNRRYLMERLRTELAFARRHRASISVILIDLDHFKRINDSLGHPAGDEVLKGVTRAVGSTIRAEDVLGRYGGEEFMLIARNNLPASSSILAERLRLCIENLEIPWQGGSIRLTTSVGVTTVHDGSDWKGDENDLVTSADKALYEAKEGGRNRVVHG